MKLSMMGIALGVVAAVPWSVARAETQAAVATEKRHLVSLDLGATYFDYAESVTLPMKSTDTGTFGALRASYQQALANDWGIAANLDVFIGKTTYDGSTQSGTPVTFSNSPNQVVNFEFLGTKAVTSEKWIVLYAGTGLHYWMRGDGKGGPGDYQERYLWIYLPAGAQFFFVKRDRWDWAADVSLRINAGGTVRAYNSQVDSSLADTDLPLGLALGGRLAFPVNIRWSESWALRVLPYAEYMAIGQGSSEDLKTATGAQTGYTLHEPSSRTWLLGFFIGPTFSF